MRKVLVKDLREGSIFSEPVYIDEANLLVPAGVPVREKDITSLLSWGVETVETNGVLVNPSGKAPGDAKGNPSAPMEAMFTGVPDPGPENPASANQGTYGTYIDLIERLDEVCDDIANGISVKANTIDDISGPLLHAVRDERFTMIGFILGGDVKGHSTAKSLVNTAILSALIAEDMKLPPHKILYIITGALLHDVGMLRMPKNIVEKRGGLSAPELQQIQSHPLLTHQIVIKELFYSEEVGSIVLQHHERWDGEGYPNRISGENIEIGARIVSVADAFEAMVSQKPYRNSMMGYQAMKNLLSDNLRRFDPDVIKTFIQTMGIYPISSFILLNNGALARVVNVHGNAPLRPSIRILVDEYGKIYSQGEGAIIDLLAEKNLFITKAVDPSNLKEFSNPKGSANPRGLANPRGSANTNA